MTLAAALFLALGLAAPAAAVSYDVSVDPRYELLGVVQELAGVGRTDAETAAYRKAIELRFGAFRGHPAVTLARDFAASRSHDEACSTILIYYTAPPELKLKDKDADIHYLNGDGDREEMQRFLWELRDFARVSNFMAFYKENEAFYRAAEDETRSRLGGVDPIPEIESFLGLSLDSRAHYILPTLARGAHDFIVPYPLPPANLGAKSFEVYTISASGDPMSYVWPESLYVFIDPSYYYFEKLNVPDPVAFFGPEIARCRGLSPDCTKDYVVSGLIDHLNRRTGGRPANFDDRRSSSELDRRYMKALSERLDEYERERVRYPTLWTFYPRLFSVFYELAHDGKPAKLSVPAEPAIRGAADFFDPKVVSKLVR